MVDQPERLQRANAWIPEAVLNTGRLALHLCRLALDVLAEQGAELREVGDLRPVASAQAASGVPAGESVR
jgi:hypothetical protein